MVPGKQKTIESKQTEDSGENYIVDPVHDQNIFDLDSDSESLVRNVCTNRNL